MINIYKKTLSLILIGLFICSLFNNISYAQDINSLQVSGIQSYNSDKGYDYIYLGKKEDGAIRWKVLSTSGNATGEGSYLTNDQGNQVDNADALFLLIDQRALSKNMYAQGTSVRKLQYTISLIKQWCDLLASKGNADEFNVSTETGTDYWKSGVTFEKNELISLLSVTKNGVGNIDLGDSVITKAVTKELNNDKFFIPSLQEMSNSQYGFLEDFYSQDENRGLGGYYIRTTAYLSKSAQGACRFNGMGILMPTIEAANGITENYNIYIATNLCKDAILFATAADSEKTAFSKTVENTTHEWKLTLKDDKDFSDGASVDVSKSAPGKELAITHKNLSDVSADYDHVTAAIYDKDNNLLYYGSLNDDKAATESKLTVPEDIADGTYTLKVFGEQWNGAKNTDYASGIPFETELTIDSAAVAIEEVNETIEGLPAIDKITMSDKGAVEAARKAYDALSKEQKEKVDAETLKKLTDAEAKIAELQKAADTQSSTPTTETPASTKPTQTPTVKTAVIKKGSKVTVGNINYKVTSINAKSRAVTVTGMKNKKKTSVKIPATIKIKKISYKVTAIANNAFKGNKKLKKVTIGANVRTIGKNGFTNCKNLKKIIVKTKGLKKVGAKSLKGIHKKAVIKVPAKKLKAYKKKFKKKGQAKTVRIRK